MLDPPAKTETTNTAITSPDTERNVATGVCWIRLAAITADALRAWRNPIRLTSRVSQGPMTTMPTRISRKPTIRSGDSSQCLTSRTRIISTAVIMAARPASKGMVRHMVGVFSCTARVTPKGPIPARSVRCAATSAEAATTTATTTAAAAQPVARSAANIRVPLTGICAAAGLSRMASPTPSTAPIRLGTEVSTAAIRETTCGDAPMRRRVAKRSRRWAAPRPVTMLIRSRTGKNTAMAPMDSTVL